MRLNQILILRLKKALKREAKLNLKKKSKAPNAGSETGKLKSERSQSIPFHHHHTADP